MAHATWQIVIFASLPIESEISTPIEVEIIVCSFHIRTVQALRTSTPQSMRTME